MNGDDEQVPGGTLTSGQLEAAKYISECLGELAGMANTHRLETLGYLLGMAHLEARQICQADL